MKVYTKRINSYDLVGQPGFSSAKFFSSLEMNKTLLNRTISNIKYVKRSYRLDHLLKKSATYE